MSTTDLPGSSLLAGRYRLVERLGAGGMSVVWRGFDEVLGRQVAVKVLPPSTSADPSFRRRLRAEAQAAARLSHPNITNVYDYGEATTADGEPVPYVVMELIDGESLAAVLARVRRLPWPAAVRICSEVSAALAAAHSRGIVHRDVTPANVMLTPSGAKVVDFGISALIGENDIDPDGSLLGTPAYLAPERLEGGQVSPATDVYAVGLLIYRTLIGQLPWDVGTTTALLRAHQYIEPDPLPPVEGLPVAVSTLIGRCLEKRPDDRPSSAELAHVLAGVSAGTPASRGFVPDWADSSEDTTILPSAYPYTDGIGRIRPGHARVPETQPGRGVAAVRKAAEGPAGLAAAAAAMAAAAEISADAPVSPAPGNAIPVPVSDVEAALAGERVDDNRPVAAAVSPAAPSAGAAAPAAAPPGGHRGPGQHPGRNNRFGLVPSPGPVAAAAAASAPPSPARPVAPLRPAFAGSVKTGNPAPAQRPGDGGPPKPPGDRPGGSGSGDGDGKGPWRGLRQDRRILIVAGLVILLGGGAYALSVTTGADNDVPAADNQPVPTVSTVAHKGKCVVSYAVWSDRNGRYKASVTVANRQNAAIKDWKLWFINQGDQTLNGNGKVDLTQDARAVTISSDGSLSPQKAVTMEITGRYRVSNAAPMVFELNNEKCETYVSSKPGEPSRPVQTLANGQIRLGPPAKDNPVPGITIGPGGVVTPVPLPPTTTGPTTPGTSGTTPETTPPTTRPTTTVAPEPVEVETTTPPTTVPTTTSAVPPTVPTTDPPDPTDTQPGSGIGDGLPPIP